MVKCPHCKGTGWRTEVIEPTGAKVKVTAIVCKSCHAPAGFVPFDDIAAILLSIESKLKRLL